MSSDKIVRGPKLDFRLGDYTLGRLLFEYADRFSDKICQIDASTDQSETFSSVKLRAVRLAIELQKKGITSKDVIVSCSYNTVDSAIPVIASMFLGAKVVNLDPTLSTRNTAYLLELVTPTIVFVDEPSLELIEDSLSKSTLGAEIIMLSVSDRYLTLDNLSKPQKEETAFEPPPVDIHDTAVMFFSSGTTGMPKAICHSHFSFIRMMEIYQAKGFKPENMLYFTTFYWISGVMMLLNSFLNGSIRVFGRDMSGENVLKVVEKYRIAFMFMAPVFTYNLTNVEKPQRFDTSSVRALLTGGTPISTDQLKRLTDLFVNADIFLGYGMTEVGLLTIFNPETDKDFIRTKVGSCGNLVPETEIKVVDPDTEEILGAGEKGEIRIKSSGLMLGYYRKDSSDSFDSEGYLKSGDLGYYDEDGCFYIVDRMKEMFKYQSWHIVPSSIEAVLNEHPAVKEAAVFGIPRGEVGEVPAACVVLKENCVTDKEDIENFVQQRVSDREKLRGGIVFVKTLPKTPTGKIIRREIKDIAIALI